MDISRIKYQKGILVAVLMVFVFAGTSQAQTPIITSIDKDHGAVNDTVAISGSGFGNSTLGVKVFFGAAESSVLTVVDNLIQALVPGGSTISSISVTNIASGHIGYSSDLFFISFGGSGFDPSLLDGQFDFAAQNGLFDLVMVDIDGDGKNDVVTSHQLSNFVNIYRNTSTLSTVSFVVRNLDLGAPTLNLTSRDLDGDGKPDLVFSREGGTGGALIAVRNNSTPGSLSFDSPVLLPTAGAKPRRIVIRDLNGDGTPEIIATNQASKFISVFRNLSSPGSLSFGPEITFGLPDTILASAGLAVEDLNGDDRPEIVVNPFLSRDIYIFENTTNSSSVSFAPVFLLNVSGNLSNLVVGDLNDDNLPEIIVTRFLSDDISVLQNTTTNTGIAFDNQKIFQVAETPVGIDLGDMDGDGKLDLMITSFSPTQQMTHLRNITTSATVELERHDIRVNEQNRNVKLGDINGDAKPDIAFTSIESFQLSILLNQNCVAPEVSPAGPLTLCSGNSLQLNATNAVGVVYQWYKDGSPIGTPGNSLTVSSGGDYWVTTTGNSGTCVETSNTVAVTEIGGGGSGTPLAGNNGPICLGATLDLTTSFVDGGTYSWTGPNGFISDQQNPSISNFNSAMAGDYQVIISTGACVSAPGITNVVESIVPDLTITTSDLTTFCVGKSATLYVPSVPGLSYQWLRDGIVIAGANTFGVVASQSGFYTVAVTNADGCSKESAPMEIKVTPPPTAGFSAPSTACLNLPVTFTDSSLMDTSLNVFYQWDFGDGATSTNQNPNHTYAALNTYTVSLTVHYDDVDCSDTYSRTIDVVASPTVSIIADRDTVMCENDTINLSVDDIHTSYLWSTGATNSSIAATDPGIYTVEVVTTAGCITQAQIEVVTLPLPDITTSVDIDRVFAGDTVQLTATGGFNYSWTPVEGLSDPNSPNPTAIVDRTTTYTVLAEGTNGCFNSAEVTVRVGDGINVNPKPLFSPNNDGQNDRWVIQNMERYPDCTVSIFNRQGNLLFEQKSYSGNEWDGTFNGQPVIEGAYYFVVRCPDSNKNARSGSLTLIR
ncbi:MAG: FG-GAP-like repeat-containing protein [Cyclobacteriaceae bacterium]